MELAGIGINSPEYLGSAAGVLVIKLRKVSV
jgi:hypothetical protein